MNQLSLFDAAPAAKRPPRPDMAMLLAMTADAPPRFTKQATPAQAASLMADINASRDAAFCLSKIKGHEVAKRAIEIAVTGGHSLALPGQWMGLCACAWNLAGYQESGAYINDPAQEPERSYLMQVLPEEDNAYGEDESSAIIAARIAQCRDRIAATLIPLQLDERGASLLNQAQDAMAFNDHQRAALVEVARTIAHMAGTEWIGRIHIAEAISYWKGRL